MKYNKEQEEHLKTLSKAGKAEFKMQLKIREAISTSGIEYTPETCGTLMIMLLKVLNVSIYEEFELTERITNTIIESHVREEAAEVGINDEESIAILVAELTADLKDDHEALEAAEDAFDAKMDAEFDAEDKY